MKNLRNGNRLKSFGRLLSVVFFAISAYVATANAVELPNGNSRNAGTASRVANAQAASNSSTLDSTNDASGREPVLIAQLEYCYTAYGAYPMVVWMPVGSSCHVNVAFYPYLLYGVVGF